VAATPIVALLPGVEEQGLATELQACTGGTESPLPRQYLRHPTSRRGGGGAGEGGHRGVGRARLLALQGEDGQWAGGACFPGGWIGPPDENHGQPWTATLSTLHLLLEVGIDPDGEQVRRAVAQVAKKCLWECDDLPFFAGEEDPCINGRTVALGVKSVKTSMASSPDSSPTSSRTVGGTAGRSTARPARPITRPSMSWKDCRRTSALPVARRSPSRPGAGVRSFFSKEPVPA
jgi:hypothetical protein